MPATAQVQFQELGKRGLPTDKDATQATALGDVDGDGDVDLVVGNAGLGGGQSRLYLNDGTGAFADATATSLPVGSYATTALALGDVDRDGDLDLFVGNFAQQSRLYLNNGAGTFTDATAARLPAGPHGTRSLALGDLDGDGDLDLVVGNTSHLVGEQSLLYLNDGSGTFTDATASRMPVGSYETIALALGDIDRDGDLDLVVGNFSTAGSQSRLYLNHGTGTFTDATATQMPVGSYPTFALALGDVDRDGDLDLVVGNLGQQSRLYRNDGTGTFTDATARLPVSNEQVYALAFGDADGDGDLDLFLGGYGQQSRLYLNDGSGVFTDATAARLPAGLYSTRSVTLGDVDRDGDLDVLVGNDSQPNRLYLNNGAAVFADATASRMPLDNYGAHALALGDIDGDGDLDVMVGSAGSNGSPTRMYLNSGFGTFAEASATRMPSGSNITRALALGDVDGDGDLDLVVGNAGIDGSQSRLYVNNGAGTFIDAMATRMPVGSHLTTSLALSDVDRDGDLDLVVGNSGRFGGQSRLYLNSGNGTFTDATASHLPVVFYDTTALALGDVDGDGDGDLVLGNGGQSRLYLNNGSGRFADATAPNLPVGIHSTRSLAIGDVDGDGDLDLLVGNVGQSRLYRNNGTGTFTDATPSSMPVGVYNTTALALGDVDRDGDLDLVVGDLVEQRLLYVNNGTGMFTDATGSRMPVDGNRAFSLVLGDVDRDGDLDQVVGAGKIVLYVNLLHQLDAPYVLHIGRNYQLDAYSRYRTTTTEFAFPFLATGTANIPLPPFGIVGIDPTRTVALPVFAVPQPAGIGSLMISVPNQASMAGVTFYTQALLTDTLGPARLTNVGGDITLR